MCAAGFAPMRLCHCACAEPWYILFRGPQEPNKDQDEELVRKVNLKMNGEAAGDAAPAGSGHQMDQASLLALFEVPHAL